MKASAQSPSISPAASEGSVLGHRPGERGLPWIFILPAILLVLAVTAIPIIHAFSYSLYDTQYLKRTLFLGLAQYQGLFTDPLLRENLVNSFVFVFSCLFITLPVGMIAALILNEPIPFRIFFRTAFLLPWVVAQIVTALLWNWMVNGMYGPLTFLLEVTGVGRIDFLSHPQWAMATLVLANVWRSFGFVMIMVLAALQVIPRELYEAARCDGAGPWQCFCRITLPYLAPTLMITVIMQTLNDFNIITLPLVLTGGGPFNATQVLGIRVYKEAFEFWHIGLGSAIAVVIFIINIVFSLLYIRLLRRES